MKRKGWRYGVFRGRIGEGGFEGIILCVSLTQETFRFAVPSAFALTNYMYMT
jgi:hypothetical protein